MLRIHLHSPRTHSIRLNTELYYTLLLCYINEVRVCTYLNIVQCLDVIPDKVMTQPHSHTLLKLYSAKLFHFMLMYEVDLLPPTSFNHPLHSTYWWSLILYFLHYNVRNGTWLQQYMSHFHIPLMYVRKE